MKHNHSAAKLIITYILSLLIMWALLVMSSTVSNKSIGENILGSAMHYSGMEPYRFTDSEKLCSIEDNYADVITLGVLWNIKSDHPFSSSLDTKYYDGGEKGVNYGLYRSLYGEAPNTDYTRYWHGTVTFIRPLLMITDVQSIKLIGYYTAVAIAAAAAVILYLKKRYFTAAGFLFSLLSIQIFNIKLSLEYQPAFIICFIMCLMFICLEKKGTQTLMILSVISGAATAFYDFLTAETVTITLPLLLVLLMRYEGRQSAEKKESIYMIVKCLGCWLISYMLTFIVKWEAASIVTGENKFTGAFGSAQERVIGEAEGVSGIKLFISSVPACVSSMFGGDERVDILKATIGLSITAAVFTGLFIIFGKGKGKSSVIIPLFILGIVPIARFFVLSNHSYMHCFFAYRALAASVLSLWGILQVSAAKPPKANSDRRKKK